MENKINLNEIPRVENMKSPASGRECANQFIISGNGWELFQSYSSPVVMFKYGVVYIWSDAFYSQTTSRYRNRFLGEDKSETIAKLKSGEYIAVDFKPEDL